MAVHELFVERLDTLRPNPTYLGLFREIVLDVWRSEKAQSASLAKTLDARRSELERRLDRLHEAFLYRGVIDQVRFERERDKLQQELTLAELETYIPLIQQGRGREVL